MKASVVWCVGFLFGDFFFFFLYLDFSPCRALRLYHFTRIQKYRRKRTGSRLSWSEGRRRHLKARFLFCLFLRWLLLCTPDWPGTCYVAQAGLTLRCLSQVLGLMAWATTPCVFFLMLWVPHLNPVKWMFFFLSYTTSSLCNRFFLFSVILVWQVDISLRYTHPWNNTERDRFQVSICS